MSAILDLKRAVERRLSTLDYQIAFEGVNFEPNPAVAHLYAQLAFQEPEDPVIGDRYYRERCTFRVFVADVLNQGTAAAIAKAEEVRALFPKGFTLQEGSTRIYVLSTPNIQGCSVTTDRLVVPVLITLVAEVYN